MKKKELFLKFFYNMLVFEIKNKIFAALIKEKSDESL